MSDLICPSCQSPDVRRSHRRWWDRLPLLRKLTPFRCRSCRHRFWKKITLPADQADRADRATKFGTSAGSIRPATVELD